MREKGGRAAPGRRVELLRGEVGDEEHGDDEFQGISARAEGGIQQRVEGAQVLPTYMLSRGHIRSRAGSNKAKENKVALATAMASADFFAPETQVFGAINPSNGTGQHDGVVVGQATPRTGRREQHTTTTRSAGEPRHGARLKPGGGDQKHRRQQVARTMTHSGAWRLGTKATSVYRCLTCSSRRFLTCESRRLCERAHTHTHTPSPSLFTHTHVNACLSRALTHARTQARAHTHTK